MPKPTPSPFTILGFEEIGPKPDGTPRRNRWAVMVELDGSVHRVFIRRSHNQVHTPFPLRVYPALSKIKRAVKDLMEPVIKAAMEADGAAVSTQAASASTASEVLMR